MSCKLICSRCEAETAQEDRFCQECGLEQEPKLQSPKPVAVATTYQAVPQSNYANLQGLLEKAKYLSGDLLVVSLMFLFALTLGYWAYGQYQKNQEQSISSILKSARNNIAAQKYDQALRLMLSLEQAHNAYPENQLVLLDEIYYQIGRQKFESKNFAAAMVDLLKVRPESGRYSAARTMILENSIAHDPSFKKKLLAEKQSKKSVVILPAKALLSEEKILAIPSLSELKARAHSAKELSADSQAVVPSADSNSAPAKSSAKFSEGDMARYNKLLANYFFNSTNNAKPSSDANSEETVPVKAEPPTFKEWLEQGSPQF